jgi:hypothetical protein
VLKEVKNGEMPRDDMGLRKDIDPQLRAAILTTGRRFPKHSSTRINGNCTTSER